jgi:hypothetical protein
MILITWNEKYNKNKINWCKKIEKTIPNTRATPSKACWISELNQVSMPNLWSNYDTREIWLKTSWIK